MKRSRSLYMKMCYRTISINILLLLAALVISMGMSSCDEETVYTPKPKGYFSIDLPEHEYTRYTNPSCPYSFEYPTYATVSIDSLFFQKKTEDPCWLDINIPELGGEIHLSYKQVGANGNTLEKLVEDAHKLTYKHTIKADYIDEKTIMIPQHSVEGLLYEVGGNAASSTQFYVTDGVEHFLRGSLYFTSAPNRDSMNPIINHVHEDLMHMIGTLEWE